MRQFINEMLAEYQELVFVNVTNDEFQKSLERRGAEPCIFEGEDAFSVKQRETA